MIKLIGVFIIVVLLSIGIEFMDGVLTGASWAQQAPSWEDIAIEAQKSATMDQISSNAIIGSLQAEIRALKAEVAKASKPADKPPSGGVPPIKAPGGG
jgi:hypothetical protein